MLETEQRAVIGAFLNRQLVARVDVPNIPHRIHAAVRDLRGRYPDAYIMHKLCTTQTNRRH